MLSELLKRPYQKLLYPLADKFQQQVPNFWQSVTNLYYGDQAN